MRKQRKVVIGLSCIQCGPQSKWRWESNSHGRAYICECGEESYDLVFAQYENKTLYQKKIYTQAGEFKQLNSTV